MIRLKLVAKSDQNHLIKQKIDIRFILLSYYLTKNELSCNMNNLKPFFIFYKVKNCRNGKLKKLFRHNL